MAVCVEVWKSELSRGDPHGMMGASVDCRNPRSIQRPESGHMGKRGAGVESTGEFVRSTVFAILGVLIFSEFFGGSVVE